MLEKPLIAIENLLHKYNKRLGPESLQIIMINFDEAANLVLSENDNRFHALRRILSTLINTCLWTTFLSTNSAIEVLAPKLKHERSDRVARGLVIRLPPFTAFKLNLENDTLEANNGTRELSRPINSLGTIEHVSKFGRPLWKAYAGGSEDSNYDWNIIRFVHNKLVGSGNFDPNDENHVFAVLSFRISLDPITNVPSAELCKNAVDFHLRALVSMDSRNRILETITPSEPLVADIAAQILNGRFTPNNASLWPDTLRKLAGNLLGGGKVD